MCLRLRVSRAVQLAEPIGQQRIESHIYRSRFLSLTANFLLRLKKEEV